jgi:Acetyltransferases, including N-acetylases of ribosomal proteins
MTLTTDTGRLVLRHFRLEDAQDVYEACRNPALGDNAGWKPHDDPAESARIIETVFGGDTIWAVTERGIDRVIGSVGLIPDQKRGNPLALMLGYWIGQEHWGKGYAQEAARAVLSHGFSAMSANLISAYCYPDNLRSRNVLERLGFEYEGYLHQAEIAYDGRVLDVLCFYLTSERYESIVAPGADRTGSR